MTSNEKSIVPLTQIQPANIVEKTPISVIELNELRDKIEEQQKKLNNIEMLGTAVAQRGASAVKDRRLTNTWDTSRDKKITCNRWESAGVL